MTSKKELIVVVSNGNQLLHSCWCPKSPRLALDKILLLSDESLLKEEDRKKIIYKSGSSNLLVDKAKSIAKLIFFFFALKVVLPNSKVCVSEISVWSNSVWSILTRLLRNVQCSLPYKGQWRRLSVSLKMWLCNKIEFVQYIWFQ